MGTRQARASAAQAISVRPEGRRPFATWYSVARYPAAASPSRTKKGTEPSSGRTRPKVRSASPTMAPPAPIRWRARIGLVASSGALVVVCVLVGSPRREQRGSARRSSRFDAQLGGEPEQIRRHVDVVPCLGEGHGQSERARL